MIAYVGPGNGIALCGSTGAFLVGFALCAGLAAIACIAVGVIVVDLIFCSRPHQAGPGDCQRCGYNVARSGVNYCPECGLQQGYQPPEKPWPNLLSMWCGLVGTVSGWYLAGRQRSKAREYVLQAQNRLGPYVGA